MIDQSACYPRVLAISGLEVCEEHKAEQDREHFSSGLEGGLIISKYHYRLFAGVGLLLSV